MCKNTGMSCCFLEWDLHDPGTKHASLASPSLAGRFFTTVLPGKHPSVCWNIILSILVKVFLNFWICTLSKANCPPQCRWTSCHSMKAWIEPKRQHQGEFILYPWLSSVQFSPVAQLCPTLRPHELQHAYFCCW